MHSTPLLLASLTLALSPGLSAVAAAPEPAPPRDVRTAEHLVEQLGTDAAWLSVENAAERLERQPDLALAAEELDAELGERRGGSWIDARTGNLVVGVTRSADIAVVRERGAEPLQVERSLADLERTRDTVVQLGRDDPGLLSSVAVDTPANKVVVEVSPEAPASAEADVVASLSGVDASAVTVRRAEVPLTREGAAASAPSASPQPLVGPEEVKAGQSIEDESGNVCTLNFATRATGGTPTFLTAGHCVDDLDDIRYRDGEALGLPWKTTLDRIDDSASGLLNPVYFTPTATVDAYGEIPDVAITGQREAPIGGAVCLSGAISGLACGTVLAKDVTVFWGGEVPVQEGVTKYSSCSAAGDSGAPVYTTDGQAQGLHLGGPAVSSCSGEAEPSKGRYFQPIADVLDHNDLRLQLAP